MKRKHRLKVQSDGAETDDDGDDDDDDGEDEDSDLASLAREFAKEEIQHSPFLKRKDDREKQLLRRASQVQGNCNNSSSNRSNINCMTLLMHKYIVE